MQQATIQFLKTEDANYRHLVLDSGWYGLGLPAVLNFFSMYAIRLGATPIELGWMSAMPALFLLLSSVLTDRWRRRYPDSVKALLWPAFVMRLRLPLYALVPLLPLALQVPGLIVVPTLFALPMGVSSIIFLVLLREAVSDNRLTALVSRRLLASNAAVAIATLVLGVWLEKAPFPLGYQVMYIAGFLAMLVSLWHAMQVRILQPTPALAPAAAMTPPPSQPASGQAWRVPTFRRLGLILTVLFVAFYSIGPVIPLYLVRNLGAEEGFVALYSLMELIGGVTLPMLANRLIRRHGHRRMIALGMAGTGLAALILAAVPAMGVALLAALISGAAWALTDISQFGLFSANTAPEDRASYTKAYYQVLSVASFIGPLVGSSLANGGVSLVVVLLLGAGLRAAAALLVERRAPVPAAPPTPLPLPEATPSQS